LITNNSGKGSGEMLDYNKWTMKRLFLTAVFAAATFAASFAGGIVITTSIAPGMSGIVTILLTTILAVIGALVVDTLGVFVVLVTLFTLFAWPTTMFGPPGPQKILIGLVTGLTYDLCWRLFSYWRLLRDRKLALPIAASAATAVAIVLIAVLLTYLNHPRKDLVVSILKWLIPLYAALGFVGAWYGQRLYYKTISKLSIVDQLKA